MSEELTFLQWLQVIGAVTLIGIFVFFLLLITKEIEERKNYYRVMQLLHMKIPKLEKRDEKDLTNEEMKARIGG